MIEVCEINQPWRLHPNNTIIPGIYENVNFLYTPVTFLLKSLVIGYGTFCFLIYCYTLKIPGVCSILLHEKINMKTNSSNEYICSLRIPSNILICLLFKSNHEQINFSRIKDNRFFVPKQEAILTGK